MGQLVRASGTAVPLAGRRFGRPTVISPAGPERPSTMGFITTEGHM